jgi:hypothetical protein
MRLSREKVVHISHLIIEKLEKDHEIKLIEDSNTVRNYIVDIFIEQLLKDEQMEEAARKRIRSMKKNIIEGSRDWDILFWKFYHEELDKLRQVKE